MQKNKGIHWEFYENFKEKCPETYAKLKDDVNDKVRCCINKHHNYILSQDIVSKLVVDEYQLEQKIPDNILHSLAGMELYNLVHKKFKWNYDKITILNRDYDQTIYFKGKEGC